MDLVWQLLLFPPALVISALTFEANIWCVYGYVTFREGRFARFPFRVLRAVVVVLMLVSLIAPWAVLVRAGLWAADLTWIGLSLAVFLFIYAGGRFVEWKVNWFFDVERDRRALREVSEREQEMFGRVIAEWPRLGAGERRKFLQAYGSYPLHMREVFFIRLLDSFPTVSQPADAPAGVEPLTAMRMKAWGGAHLFNTIEALLEMRHRLAPEGLFRGPIPVPTRNSEHPEAQGEVMLARVGEDAFVICPQ